MTEAIESVADLSPLAAIVVIAGLAAMIITQGVKRTYWTKGQAEVAALVVSAVIGLTAYIVSGLAGVFPPSVVEAVSTAVVVIAAVALTSRAAYAIVGRAIPDGRPHDKPATTTVVNLDSDMDADEARALAKSIKDSQRDG